MPRKRIKCCKLKVTYIISSLLVGLGCVTGEAKSYCRNGKPITAVFHLFGKSATEIQLAKKSVPLADIVIAPDADESLRFAADELKLHLDKITGASFSIVSRPAEGRKSLRIAYSPKLAQQELSISFSSAGVALESGGFPEYAVWDFLRDYCGVSWLDPTDAGTIIPSKPNLSLKRKNRKDRPFAKGRNPGNMFDGRRFNASYSPELWAAGSRGWTNYLHIAYPSVFSNTCSFADAMREIDRRKKIFLRRMKAGGVISNTNHSYYWWYSRFWDRTHSKFEKFRPELFAKGYENSKSLPPICYSSPETLMQTIEDVRAYFDNGGFRITYPNIGRTGYFWGEDVYCIEPIDSGPFCNCENCTRQYRPDLEAVNAQHSDYWFGFVNKVAKALGESHPGKTISTLAYSTRCGVPTFNIEPNIVVHFCFSCNRIPYVAKHARQKQQIQDWREAYPSQLFGIWLYNTFPKEYSFRVTHVNCFPGFFAHVLKDEYDLFYKYDVAENIFYCGFVDDYENFLSLRWMWDPREALDALEKEYFSSYGKAMLPIKDFYRKIEERYCDSANYSSELLEKSVHQSAHIAWDILGTADLMRQLGALIAEAERLADTPLARARVANWKAGIWDYMKEGAAYRK